MKDVRKMYSYTEVMEMCGIKSRSTLWRWMKDGKLTPTQVGRKIYFTENALRKLEKSWRTK